MIDLYYCATPNGQKVSIMLEETGLPYNPVVYDIFAGDQHTAEFGRINPNHKLPAIVDRTPSFGGEPHAVFESGAILQYLAEKSGAFLSADPRKRSTTIQWLTWQIAGLGPMGGQASHFMRYAPVKLDYAIERYTSELKRLLQVLNKRLGDVEYVAGDEYSIADIAIWPGRNAAGVVNMDLSEYPNTRRWFDLVAARPAVKRALASEKLQVPEKYMRKTQNLSPDEWSNMFGEKMRAAVTL